jgi:hypothetical protein
LIGIELVCQPRLGQAVARASRFPCGELFASKFRCRHNRTGWARGMIWIVTGMNLFKRRERALEVASCFCRPTERLRLVSGPEFLTSCQPSWSRSRGPQEAEQGVGLCGEKFGKIIVTNRSSPLCSWGPTARSSLRGLGNPAKTTRGRHAMVVGGGQPSRARQADSSAS